MTFQPGNKLGGQAIERRLRMHRLANLGKFHLELIEVEVGGYLGQDDLERLDDVCGRG